MNIWDEFDFERRIMAILADVQSRPRPDLLFGQPFLTAYQLAIAYATRHREDFERLGYPIGGEDGVEGETLARYIANQLSRRISDEHDPLITIEGAFIAVQDMETPVFIYDGQRIPSSLGSRPISMFRLRQP